MHSLVERKMERRESILLSQFVPLLLTVVTAMGLVGFLWVEVAALNRITTNDIVPAVRWTDVLLGLTIYLKTSIDFAIFIARLMDGNTGWRSRVAIELGSAIGNAAGTVAILALWTFFKEVRPLLALMILVAALVLFKLAEEGLEHAKTADQEYPRWFQRVVSVLEYALERVNGAIAPVLKFIIPKFNVGAKRHLHFWPLFLFAFTIPFVLGLDDFAGYVPLFNVVNVFGVGAGDMQG